MTIAARQQRALSKIECTLRGTDPQLAAKFGMFSWLTSGEEMPRVEHLTSPPPRQRGNTGIGQLSVRLWVVLCFGTGLFTAIGTGRRLRDPSGTAGGGERSEGTAPMVRAQECMA